MIDNNRELCNSMQTVCFDAEIGFDFATDLHTGIGDLREKINDFDLIILDGKGFLTPEHTDERAVHVTRGFQKIRRLSDKINIVIYTAYIDDVEEQLEGIIDEKPIIIDKGDYGNLADFINKLREIVGESELYILKRKYPELFKIFDDGFLDDEYIDRFIALLTCVENNSFNEKSEAEQRGLLTDARTIQEHIYNQINVYFELLEDCVRFNDKKKVLTGNRDGNYEPTTKVYQNQAIEYFTQAVNWNPPLYTHAIENQRIPYTRFAFNAIAYALFEVMMWYKQGIETGLFET